MADLIGSDGTCSLHSLGLLARVCLRGSFLSPTPETPKGWNPLTHTYVCGVCMPRDANLSGNIWKSTTPSRLRSSVSCLLRFFYFSFLPHFFCGADLLYFLVIRSSFHSLETKERGTREKDLDSQGQQGGSPDQRASLSLHVCVVPPRLCIWRIVSTERIIRKAFPFTRKDTLSPARLLFFCDVSNHHDGRTKHCSLPCTHRHASHLYIRAHTDINPLFCLPFFFCLS